MVLKRDGACGGNVGKLCAVDDLLVVEGDGDAVAFHADAESVPLAGRVVSVDAGDAGEADGFGEFGVFVVGIDVAGAHGL